jgi:hypothetical protein
MKRIMLAFLALASVTVTMAQKKVADVAKFSVETYDFGKIKQNVPAVATFTVTNVSKEPLIIEQANPTCGCTISDYTKTPIAPGQTGTIKATYNAAAVGAIHKSLTVKFAGVDEIKSINLAGEVEAAPSTGNNTNAGKATEVKRDEVKAAAATQTTVATPVTKVKTVESDATGKTKTKTKKNKTKVKAETKKAEAPVAQ